VTSFDVTGNIEPLTLAGSSSAVLTVVSGDTLYYDFASTVSAGSHAGALTAGQSVTITTQAWLVSASRSSVTVTFATAQDPSSDGTGLPACVVSGASSGGAIPWVASTQFSLNQLVSNSGTVYICKTAHTSGGSFDATKFTALGGGGSSTTQPDSPNGSYATPITGASYTAQASDLGTVIVFSSATAQTLTIPTGLTTDGVINVWQVGAGQVTIAAGAGMAPLANAAKSKTSGQYALAGVRVVDASHFQIFGDIA
jgi:hypothetical protein